MRTKNSGFAASGSAQPEIRPGDRWQDKSGLKITVTALAFNRVTFIRDGYQHPCTCTPDRLKRDFVQVEKMTLPEWCRASNPAEKVERLREILRAGREKQP